VDEYEGLLTGNPIFLMRVKGVAHLSMEDAIAMGATGPTLRGSGVDIDLRRDAPYSAMKTSKFKVPVPTAATYGRDTSAASRSFANRSA